MDMFRMEVKAQMVKNAALKKETVYRVQVGAFGIRDNAERLVKELKAKGYKDAAII
jgi:cell division septation protein DedD